MSVAGAQQSVGDLRRVSGAVDAAQGSLTRFSGGAAQVGRGVGQVAGGLVRVAEVAAAAILTASGASAKFASEFQAQMELIHTQAGASQQEVVDQTKAVQGLVHAVGTAPIELAKGLYHIESVGVRGKAALDILQAGALGAKTGLADMETTTNALTAVFFSGIGGVKNMTEAMGDLDAIVGVGNMRLQDLVDSFGTGILGTAKTFGVGLKELGSALAVLTDAGVPANVAATRLSMTFSHFANPTTKAALGVFKRLGADQFEFARDLRQPNGVFVAFDDLRDRLEKVGELKDGVLTPQGTRDVLSIFGGSRFGATAMQLLGQVDRIDQKFTQIGAGQQAFGDRVAKTMETAGFHWTQFISDVKNDAIVFGTAVLPSLIRALGRLDDFVVSHLGDVRHLGEDIGRGIDGIDWAGVEQGANTFVGYLQTGFDLLKKIPPQVDVIVAGFLGLNKISGGLLGGGLGNIVEGLGKGIANISLSLLTRVPGVGGAIGAVTATRVFVVNWPLGMGAGSAGGGVAGVAGAAEGGLSVFGKLFLIGEAIGLVAAVNDVRVAISDQSSAQATDVHTTLDNSLAQNPTMAELKIKLDTINHAIDDLFHNPTAGIVSGNAMQQLVQMRTETMAAIENYRSPSSPDDRNANWTRTTNLPTWATNLLTIASNWRTELHQIAENTATSAQRLGVIAGIRVPGKVPTVAHLGAIGSSSDPYGFSHLKAFAEGKIPAKDMQSELIRHIAEVNSDIARETRLGHTSTVTKLQETKAGLSFLLAEVISGTFVAGDKTYEAVLAVAAAADRTTVAVKNIVPGLSATIGGRFIGGYTGANPLGTHRPPGTPAPGTSGSGFSGGTGTGGGGGGTSIGTPLPHGLIPIDRLASGGIVRRRPGGIIANIGEGQYDEAVVPLDGRGMTIDIQPQPVVVRLNNRDIMSALVLGQAFTRRPLTLGGF